MELPDLNGSRRGFWQSLAPSDPCGTDAFRTLLSQRLGHAPMPHETRTYRRSELYEQVWSQPMREVAKLYGVSDVALAKTCRKLAVPVPGVGYWARKRAGRRTHRTPLPKLPAGVEEETILKWWLPDEPAPLSPEAEAVVSELQRPEAAIVVPDVLTEPHKLVAQAKKLLAREKPYEGMLRCWRDRCLDITVSPQSLDRALRIFDTLLKTMEGRALQVEITDPETFDPQGLRLPRLPGQPPPNATRVHVDGEWLRFGLAEKRSVVRKEPAARVTSQARTWSSYTQPDRAPNGVLALSIYDENYMSQPISWKDGKRLRIESRLNDFLAGLYEQAAAHKEMRERFERARLEREAEERQRHEERQRAEQEAHRAKDFQDMLARWRLARDIREFSQEAREMVANAGCSARSTLRRIARRPLGSLALAPVSYFIRASGVLTIVQKSTPSTGFGFGCTTRSAYNAIDSSAYFSRSRRECSE